MTLARVENPDNIIAALDLGRRALAEANTDFERLRIRDQAQAAAAAARILKLRDVEVTAKELVARAEREVVKANPPEQGRRNDFVINDNEVPAGSLRQMRRAHSAVDDANGRYLVPDGVVNVRCYDASRGGFMHRAGVATTE